MMMRLVCSTVLLYGLKGVDAMDRASLKKFKQASDQHTCKLWLAPSHLSQENAIKFGLFAGVDYAENETIAGSGELAVPLIDWIEGPYRDMPEYEDIIKDLESSLWLGDYAGAKFLGNYSTTVFIPGIGSLANYHAGIHNLEWVQASALMQQRDDITEPGKAHPSRGAITPYYNLTMRASVAIPAGMELFSNFGEVWDDSKVDVYEQTMTRWDYYDADKVLDRILDFVDKQGSTMSDELLEETLDFMLDTVLGAAAGKRAKNVRSLIPPNVRKLRKVKEAGGTFNYRNRDMVKSASWLKKYGICADAIVPGKSTIPEAGRGAFATRDFEAGERVAVSPMMLITHNELMDMYKIKKTKTRREDAADVDLETKTVLEYVMDEKIGQQLLVNYAFGHAQSSMLFIPLAPGVNLINHASDDKENIDVDWSFHEKMLNEHELHQKDVSDLAETDTTGIVFQFTAKQDIKKGDELFLNYGPVWEDAWEKYQQDFESLHADGKWPLKAEDVIPEYKDKPYHADIQEGDIPYPPGVVTACYIEAEEAPDGTPKVNEEGKEIKQWVGPKNFLDYHGAYLTVCDILSRKVSNENQWEYDVRTRLPGTKAIVEVHGIPHAAITLKDSPYTSDITTPGAFRHPIAFPDNRYPQAWRNLLH